MGATIGSRLSTSVGYEKRTSPILRTWAGTVLPADARVLLVLEEPADLMEATWQLLRIGYDRPIGWLAGGLYTYRKTGRPLDRLPTITVDELRERIGEFHVLDVRQPAEWTAYHAPEAQFITGAEICARLDNVPPDRDVLVTCGSGYRSSVAASVLQHAGHGRVTNLLGGMTAWKNAGLPPPEGGRSRGRYVRGQKGVGGGPLARRDGRHAQPTTSWPPTCPGSASQRSTAPSGRCARLMAAPLRIAMEVEDPDIYQGEAGSTPDGSPGPVRARPGSARTASPPLSRPGA